MQPLIDAAHHWDSLGLKIVPLKLSLNDEGKKELQPLWKWQSEAYPGYDGLDWNGANGFAVVLGQTDKGWLCYVDVDTDAPVKEDPFTVLVRAFPELQNTYIEKTPHGFHFFIYIDGTPGGNINLKDKWGLELHVNGLAVMAPSSYEGGAYTVYHNAEIISIPDFYERFKAKFLGVAVKKAVKQQRFKRRKGEIRPCISSALQNDRHIAHLMRLTIAAEYKAAGYDDHATAMLFKSQDDFDYNKTLYQVRTADPSKVASCENIKEWGYCLGLKCPHYTEIFEVTPEELLDHELEALNAVKVHPLIDFHPEVGLTIGGVAPHKNLKVIFLAEKPFLASSGFFQFRETVSPNVQLEMLRFPAISPVHLGIMLLETRNYFKNGKIDFPSKNEVFDLISGRLHYYWYHSQPEVYTLISCWIIATYFHPMFAFFPVLNVQGGRKTGKSTLLDFIFYTSWNPTGRETALREADLFRTIQDGRVTYIADITKMNTKSNRYWDLIDVVEMGTEREGCVRRIDKETGKPLTFRTYSPKAIASRESLPFLPKCIRIITEEPMDISVYSKRRAEMPFDPQWKEIVRRCILAAVKYWREVYEAYQSMEQTQRLTGRAFNYWQPILAVCKVFHPEGFDALLKYAEEYAETESEEDVLTEVEKALLTHFYGFTEDEPKRFLLKDLTAKVRELTGEQHVHHASVRSALRNLKLIAEVRNTTQGVNYQINIKRAKELVHAKRLNISVNENEAAEKQNTCEVCGQQPGKLRLRGGEHYICDSC
ncbi:MAG: bifunctional DNA primase/polymerase, partial [Candidatus Bathyarchaeia archaeon]